MSFLQRLHSPACIHDASEQRDAAELIAADWLLVLQRKETDRIRWSCYTVLD